MPRRMTQKQRLKRAGSLSSRSEHIKVLRLELSWTRARVVDDAFIPYDAALRDMGWEIPFWGPILICPDDPCLSSRVDDADDEPMSASSLN